MNSYLYYNDERNKVTNETFQGIRVVKYSGLEEVFEKRVCYCLFCVIFFLFFQINTIRKHQASASGKMTILMQLLMAMMRSLPMFVNSATFAFVIKTQNVPQERFAVDIMPTLGFLQQV
jgi:hypothetical protein